MPDGHYIRDTVWNILLADIRDGRFKDTDRLPTETELSAELGISRTQLRDALAILEQDGFISRRRGIGTVINRHVVDLNTRIDLEMEFGTMLRFAGYKSQAVLLGVEVKTNDEMIAEKLQVSLNTPILTVVKLMLADEKPAIFFIDYIAFSIIDDFSYTHADLEHNVFHFLETFCHEEVAYDLTGVKPIIADSRLSEILHIAEGDPILYLNEQAYNIENQVVLYSQEYYADGILDHTIFRRKI